MTLFEGHIFDSRRKVKSRKVSYVMSRMQCYLIFSIGSKRSLGSGTILFMFVSFVTIYILCGQQWSFFKGTFHGGSHFVTRVWVITVLIWVICILQRSCIHICFHYNAVVCNIVPYHSTGIKWLTSGVTQTYFSYYLYDLEWIHLPLRVLVALPGPAGMMIETMALGFDEDWMRSFL